MINIFKKFLCGKHTSHTANLSSTETRQNLDWLGLLCSVGLGFSPGKHSDSSRKETFAAAVLKWLFSLSFEGFFVNKICSQATSEVHVSKYLHMDLFPKSLFYLLADCLLSRYVDKCLHRRMLPLQNTGGNLTAGWHLWCDSHLFELANHMPRPFSFYFLCKMDDTQCLVLVFLINLHNNG